uniref:Vesicle transport v-SNARE N-terminal domain-containing protein n=1 Tax=Strigamia maritima TaxID=126957 RepID=T1JB09_STRMM
MSSEKFEGLEDDFKAICTDADKKINERLGRSRGEEKKKLQREIQKQVEKAEVLFDELEAEVRLAPQPFRNEMSYRVRRYKENLSQLRVKLKNSYSVLSPDPQDGYEGTNPFFDGADAHNRGILLQTNTVLGRTSDRITRSHVIAAETDEIGQNIITDLGEQRESLLRTKDRLEETDQTLSRSRRILNAMSRSMLGNKVILIVVILVEIGIFSGVLYMRFFKK